jgi:hypothetical protein
MEFDRNLRFNIDLNDFAEFSRVCLWTLGISQNAGTIRERAQIRIGTRKQAFLNHASCPQSTFRPVRGVAQSSERKVGIGLKFLLVRPLQKAMHAWA